MLNAPRLRAADSAPTRSDLAPSNSPNVNLAMLPVWQITPGSAITAAMWGRGR
jgi:hypothetical protein